MRLILALAALALAACQAPPPPTKVEAKPARTANGAPIPGEAPPLPAAAKRESVCRFASDGALTALFSGTPSPLTPAARDAMPPHVCVWMSANRRSQVSLSVLDADDFAKAGRKDAGAQYAASVEVQSALGALRPLAGLGDEAVIAGFEPRPGQLLGGMVIRKGGTVLVLDATDVAPDKLEAFARNLISAI